jgi:SPP1 family holin
MEITSGTIARTVILALALINQLLSASGHAVIPIENETIEAMVSTAATIVFALIAWWKNNSFTKAARLGDFHMRKARREAREEKNFQQKK